jgi:hypothetical protein
MRRKTLLVLVLAMFVLVRMSCDRDNACHQEMISLLKQTNKNVNVLANNFYPDAAITYFDSLLSLPHSTPSQVRYCKFLKSQVLMELGEEEQAIQLMEEIAQAEDEHFSSEVVLKELALAYLRQGERSNCIANHAAESCIMPIKGLGLHTNTIGSEKAIDIYKKLIERNPQDIELKWLINIAYMTLGQYPRQVPKQFLIPGMEGDTTYKVKPFQDVAADLKLDIKNMAGGSIVEDFDNDGFLDILLSGWGTQESMHYFKNNGDGTFIDLASKAGLNGITGGLNMMQTDYNNDGYKDVFVLRGAWKGKYGREPNSLLRNNGDNTFTDVTTKSGILSFHPTQTATWNDFNNDGWVDVFIGNESSFAQGEVHPCELFINNKNGTFSEVASVSNCAVMKFVKGVTSGDYDHDGWKDIFISTMSGQRILLKNNGTSDDKITFTDVTVKAGLQNEHGNSFPTWFWDYDNDGWLDIFACDYSFRKSLAFYEAAEKLNMTEGNPEKMLLYRNNHDGTFTNVATETGLTTNVFAMGSNFGDIDNDGFLDMYLGTGNPDYKSLVPNKMFWNLGGKKFADVTNSARVGHLQKGHGVSFADVDNDGDQDIYIEMGGAFPGDAYQNSFFLNPGQNNNHWIYLQLEGSEANRAAIGSQIKISFKENGIQRHVYRDVNSGGSFGSSPLRREIGIGQATNVDEIEIQWHGSGKTSVFKNIKPDQFYKIREGENQLEVLPLKKIQWTLPDKLCLPSPSAITNPSL